MGESFVKNNSILEEDYRVDDLLDFSNICKDFKSRLDKIDKNSVVGLIGKFGSGKSTMLYQLYKDNDGAKEKWVNFDAWKFPERKDLWEGFILEITRNLNKKIFDFARKKIDGEQNKDIMTLIKVLFKGANIFLPGASIGENFASLFKSSPAKRVFDFQEIFKEILIELNKDLYIIIEDIDRSGDRGIFFLETLRNFIKENQFKNKIIVIVPIGDKKYSDNDESRESYQKTLDLIFWFNLSKLNLLNFIEKIFDQDYLSKYKNTKSQLDYLFRLIVSEKQLTVRELKRMLRIADIEFKELSQEDVKIIDFRVFLLFIALDYIKEKCIVKINSKHQFKNDFWGRRYLMMLAVGLDENSLNSGHYKMDLPTFLFKSNNFTPIFSEDPFNRGEAGYNVSDWYMRFLND
jgi:ABC-type dipeptide/oligopeptide/nickel transport system ATPase component